MMADPTAKPALEPPTRRRRRDRVIERTLADISHTLEHTLFAEEIARRPGLLQSLDPRVKLLAMLALLVSVGLSRSLLVILALYVLALWLAWRSAIPIGFFIKRVWLFLPFFTGVMALPALFLTPGPVLVQFPPGIAITRTGVTTALFLLMRVSTSVSLAALLTFTTPWNDVLKALGILRVPDAVILIFGMTYRYIYLLLNTASDMFLSRRSRVVGHQTGAQQRRMVGASAGVLLGKSLHLSSEVYLAMQSRGYRSHARVPSLSSFKIRRHDWVVLAVVAVVTAVAVWLGQS
ncbi:MAG TPA: cobalt ECF transporter T component CbiQ [Anaerolineae bacterium]